MPVLVSIANWRETASQTKIRVSVPLKFSEMALFTRYGNVDHFVALLTYDTQRQKKEKYNFKSIDSITERLKLKERSKMLRSVLKIVQHKVHNTKNRLYCNILNPFFESPTTFSTHAQK